MDEREAKHGEKTIGLTVNFFLMASQQKRIRLFRNMCGQAGRSCSEAIPHMAYNRAPNATFINYWAWPQQLRICLLKAKLSCIHIQRER